MAHFNAFTGIANSRNSHRLESRAVISETRVLEPQNLIGFNGAERGGGVILFEAGVSKRRHSRHAPRATDRAARHCRPNSTRPGLGETALQGNSGTLVRERNYAYLSCLSVEIAGWKCAGVRTEMGFGAWGAATRAGVPPCHHRLRLDNISIN